MWSLVLPSRRKSCEVNYASSEFNALFQLYGAQNNNIFGNSKDVFNCLKHFVHTDTSNWHIQCTYTIHTQIYIIFYNLLWFDATLNKYLGLFIKYVYIHWYWLMVYCIVRILFYFMILYNYFNNHLGANLQQKKQFKRIFSVTIGIIKSYKC